MCSGVGRIWREGGEGRLQFFCDVSRGRRTVSIVAIAVAGSGDRFREHDAATKILVKRTSIVLTSKTY